MSRAESRPSTQEEEAAMHKHTLTLLDGHQGALRVPASVLHEAIGALIDGARYAARFAVEGESVRKGPRPAWLDAACAIDITALSAGSAVIALEAPTLEEADGSRFGDGAPTLFEEHDHRLGSQSAVDLFGGVLAAVIEDEPDDVLADRSLLDACVRFARVAGDAFIGVKLDGLQGRGTPLVVKPEHVPRIELLRDETPSPQAVRVAGTLDTISASRSDVILTLPDGSKVPALLEDHDSEVLKSLFGARVVVSGMARYRPSGRLLLVDVESLGPADDTDRVFARMPVARSPQPVARPIVQDEATGVSAFFGTWPGDETDGDLLDALHAIE